MKQTRSKAHLRVTEAATRLIKYHCICIGSKIFFILAKYEYSANTSLYNSMKVCKSTVTHFHFNLSRSVANSDSCMILTHKPK